MPLTQTNRSAAIETPLGDGALFLRSLSGAEQLGRAFQYDVELASDGRPIDPNKLLGQPMTCTLRDGELSEPRYVHGIVSRLARGDAGGNGRSPTFHATLVPWLWFLTRTADCRVYQQQTVPDIIMQVFRDRGFTDFEVRLSGQYAVWDYCVQYRETDFNFVSRLMEQEGFYYFFRHEQGRHVLVLADSPGSHAAMPNYATVRYEPPREGYSGGDEIARWSVSHEVQPGIAVLSDYDFTAPRKNLVSSASAPGEHTRADGEIFDYPGEYDEPAEGSDYAKLRAQEFAAQHAIYQGSGDARGISAGFTFKLDPAPQPEDAKEYLVLSTTCQAANDSYDSGDDGDDGGEPYTVSFTAIDATVQYRPPRLTPKPVVQGVQTAVVVGPAGQELFVDKYGRVKVQFHWDRDGKRDESSSCWMRVSQPVAGKRWGASFWPRIGQEVIVAFLEGDPDQPLVVGSVYNGDQKPPYLGDAPDGNHPNDPRLSGFKTNTSPGGVGFNELRFDDNKGKEQVFVHAERNLDVRVKNDELRRVYGNRHEIVGWEKDGQAGGDHRELIFQDKHLHVKRDQVEHIEGNAQLLVGNGEAKAGGNLDVMIEKNRTATVGGNSHNHVGGKRNEQVDGSISITVGKDHDEKISGAMATEAGKTIHIKAGMTVVIEAGTQLTIKAAGSFVNIGPDGVTIQGPMVKINSGGAPGSGSGASPEKPADAKKAQPTTPDFADDAKTGQKSSGG